MFILWLIIAWVLTFGSTEFGILVLIERTENLSLFDPVLSIDIFEFMPNTISSRCNLVILAEYFLRQHDSVGLQGFELSVGLCVCVCVCVCVRPVF